MKYLWAYSIPLIGFVGIYYGEFWTYSAFVYAFVAIPILELFLPINTKNYEEDEIVARTKNKLFDFLLYLNLPIVYGILFFCLNKITTVPVLLNEIIGIILSLGVSWELME